MRYDATEIDVKTLLELIFAKDYRYLKNGHLHALHLTLTIVSNMFLP